MPQSAIEWNRPEEKMPAQYTRCLIVAGSYLSPYGGEEEEFDNPDTFEATWADDHGWFYEGRGGDLFTFYRNVTLWAPYPTPPTNT